MNELKEGDIVLCTVKSVEGTTVFLDVEGNGSGSLVFSEIAAGRIRNIREYVVPNKKIVCKVLKIINGHPQLSFRRVTGKEREEVMERYKKEKTFLSILKSVSKTPEKLIEKIKNKYELVEFYDKARENPKILDEVFTKEEVQSLSKVFAEKREKEKEAKRIIFIKTLSPSGLAEIKEILSIPSIEIRYLGSSRFSLSVKSKDFKEANAKIGQAIRQMQEKARIKKLEFRIE